ncbi:MAG: ATP-binding protein [Spirochaetaceae bacterium]|jgi:hypothetical protein|nr:ATP-binding protein [Spirochaetaceae bacterium]
MTINPRKMPIGIQDFEDLRQRGFVYVDKTAYVYRMAAEGKPYFLSRPRRFGKSLFLSTLKAYFQGKRELFEEGSGQTRLAIADLETEWIEYPVFHIDLSGNEYRNLEGLELALDSNLRFIERQWERDPADTLASTRFLGLIRRACERSGRKVAVLIDEYDKPLLETMEDAGLNEDIRRGLRAFYGVLKAADHWLRFVFLTGVTKFSQVSVFSDLNHLWDISLEPDFAGVCGITLAELTGVFEPELRALAEYNDKSYEGILAETQKLYNGYHFSRNSEGVFNPFSILKTMASRELGYYWFQTGTPTFLIKLLQEADFDLRDFGKGIAIPAQSIYDYRIQGGDPIPLLYQSGYLTIKEYDRLTNEYLLDFPNEEVRYGFLNFLLPYYVPERGNGFSAGRFVKELWAGDVEGFMVRLRAFFANIPYELNEKTERYYQGIFYVLFTVMGQFVDVEVRSAAGRADAVVETRDMVYVFEFKLRGTVEEALSQIDEKGYMIPWTAEGKKLVKVGAVFDAEKRTLGAWKAVAIPT